MKKNLRKLKEVKAITLIALAITIIVMLILVGVTVTVALQGGLFDTAKDAKAKTELEQDKELLMSAALGSTDSNGIVDYTLLDTKLPTGFTGTTETYTKGGITFNVDQYGTVTIGEAQTGGDGIDFDAIKAAVIENPEEYLAQAAALGQDTSLNTNIGIGTDGNIVNLDLWKFKVIDDEIWLQGQGSGGKAYTGQVVDGHIEGTIPQYIYTDDEMLTVTTMGIYAFYNCSSLKTITIPNTVTSIRSYAFSACSSLETIIVDNIRDSISGSRWDAPNARVIWLRDESVEGQLEEEIYENKSTYLTQAAALGQNTTSNTDIGIGTDGNVVDLDLWRYKKENNGITIYGIGSTGGGYLGTITDGKIQGTFPKYIYLDSYKNLFKVTVIDNSAFYNFSTLTEITIPNSVTNISNGVFEGCSNITIKIDNTENAISGSPWGASNATVTWLR